VPKKFDKVRFRIVTFLYLFTMTVETQSRMRLQC